MTTPGDSERLFLELAVIEDTAPREAAANMALDEALLQTLTALPLLRIYRWARPAISFGYFGSWNATAQTWPDRALMRRWTGGGAVEHGDDFTYSLLVPSCHPVGGLTPRILYERIHRAVRAALLAAEWSSGPIMLAAEPSPTAGQACFQSPVAHDLIADGRKIAGAAQRRTRGGLLHQGSVRLGGSAHAAWREELARTLPQTLSAVLFPRRVAPAEEAAASRLVAEKYGTSTWCKKILNDRR